MKHTILATLGSVVLAGSMISQPAGASVVIETADAATRDAIHAFLRYQIVEHKTGDPVTVQ